jgi:hypothetical protein
METDDLAQQRTIRPISIHIQGHSFVVAPHMRVAWRFDPAYNLLMTVIQQPTNGLLFAREVAFPVLAAAVVVGSADIRIPLGLPGHRGLVWLTLLVAVALVTRRRETVIVVGAVSTMTTMALHVTAGPWGSTRYLAAAIILYAVAAAPVVRRRRWLLAVAAAPIHLVALAGSAASLLGGGYLITSASVGLAEKAVFHLGFGLLAGLLAWVMAFGMDRFAPVYLAGEESIYRGGVS